MTILAFRDWACPLLPEVLPVPLDRFEAHTVADVVHQEACFTVTSIFVRVAPAFWICFGRVFGRRAVLDDLQFGPLALKQELRCPPWALILVRVFDPVEPDVEYELRYVKDRSLPM